MVTGMKIFVTGGGGFLGKSLLGALETNETTVHAPSSADCDLTQQESLSQFTDIKYDYIYHLAAWTQAGDFCLHHPGEQWLINQRINTNVLSWWHQHQPQAKLISIGTSCSYAEGDGLREENYMRGEPISSLYTYAMTKRMLLAGKMALQSQFGLRWLCLVPTTLYGGGYHNDGRQMHFIFDLVRKILRGKHFGDNVQLWGDGYQTRELIYVSDFINIMLRLSKEVDNEVVNVGFGHNHTIRQFAGQICDVVGYDAGKIEYDETRYTGARQKSLANDKLLRLVPNAEDYHTGLQTGMEAVVQWFEETRAYGEHQAPASDR